MQSLDKLNNLTDEIYSYIKKLFLLHLKTIWIVLDHFETDIDLNICYLALKGFFKSGDAASTYRILYMSNLQ